MEEKEGKKYEKRGREGGREGRTEKMRRGERGEWREVGLAKYLGHRMVDARPHFLLERPWVMLFSLRID